MKTDILLTWSSRLLACCCAAALVIAACSKRFADVILPGPDGGGTSGAGGPSTGEAGSGAGGTAGEAGAAGAQAPSYCCELEACCTRLVEGGNESGSTLCNHEIETYKGDESLCQEAMVFWHAWVECLDIDPTDCEGECLKCSSYLAECDGLQCPELAELCPGASYARLAELYECLCYYPCAKLCGPHCEGKAMGSGGWGGEGSDYPPGFGGGDPAECQSCVDQAKQGPCAAELAACTEDH